MNQNRKILILAGESSSDGHAAELVNGWKLHNTSDKFFGLAGDAMIEAGVIPICTHEKTAVVGLIEVVRSLPFLISLARKIENWVTQNRPDVLILVDYPGFNLRLAKRLRRIIPNIWYFITPQIWAWGGKRIHEIKTLIDHCFVLFEFEQKIFEKSGIPSTWIGHPLVKDIEPNYREKICKQFNLTPETQKILFYPGSRKSELKQHLPVMKKSAELIAQKVSDWEIIFSCAPSLSETAFGNFPYRIVNAPTSNTASIADFAVTASGTNTLELALFNVPMIVVYRISPITHFFAKRMVKISDISLVNIIAGKRIIPELIQQDVNPEKIVSVVTETIQNPKKLYFQRKMLKKVQEKLGKPGAVKIAVEKMLELLS